VKTSNLTLGSIATGRSGVSGIVTQIEPVRGASPAEILVTVELPNGLKKRVPISSIVSWEPPTPNRFKVGERVKYVGDRSIKLGLPRGYQLTIESYRQVGEAIEGSAIVAKTIYRLFHLTTDEVEAIA
jgi:hypothetical protein